MSDSEFSAHCGFLARSSFQANRPRLTGSFPMLTEPPGHLQVTCGSPAGYLWVSWGSAARKRSQMTPKRKPARFRLPAEPPLAAAC